MMDAFVIDCERRAEDCGWAMASSIRREQRGIMNR